MQVIKFLRIRSSIFNSSSRPVKSLSTWKESFSKVPVVIAKNGSLLSTFYNYQHQLLRTARNFCNVALSEQIDASLFEKVCEETLESLTEYFEEIIESCPHLISADVSYSGGVLTINFGDNYGIYVINRQTPNKQIWLSSPTSGPKRYDYQNGHWLYKHDGQTLHELLQNEIGAITKTSVEVDFSKCLHSVIKDLSKKS